MNKKTKSALIGCTCSFIAVAVSVVSMFISSFEGSSITIFLCMIAIFCCNLLIYVVQSKKNDNSIK